MHFNLLNVGVIVLRLGKTIAHATVFLILQQNAHLLQIFADLI